jgi:hypothetical protein
MKTAFIYATKTSFGILAVTSIVLALAGCRKTRNYQSPVNRADQTQSSGDADEYDVRDNLHWFGPLPPAELCHRCW